MYSRAMLAKWGSIINVLDIRNLKLSMSCQLKSVALPKSKRYVWRLARRIIICIIITAFVLPLTTIILKKPMKLRLYKNDSYLNASQTYMNGPFKFPTAQGPRRDWHNQTTIDAEKARVGLGEQGLPAYNKPHKKQLENKIFMEFGFNGLLSDRISVNRSVKDLRRESCKSRQYLAKLPSVSVVMIFFDEYFSVLLRSIHSVVNRSPAELLKQIVLVDDASELQSLKTPLDKYVAANWPLLVQLVRIPKRRGLINARLTGAKVATSDIIVFLDSHIEVNYNWLPPLIEPIAIDRKITTSPIIDKIDFNNFAYKPDWVDGARGCFNWQFYYRQKLVLPEDSVDKSQPYRNPVMVGGLFAINRGYFWELGGYDDQLDIWGGEQYELSFKIWMCGGMLLDVPCSRVAHLYRSPTKTIPSPRNYDYISRNYKRVAEVWMDEYKQHIYRRNPTTYRIDAGDLSKQHAIRKRLQCKSFHWFMTVVAPDFLKRFPPVEPPAYASGTIQNVGLPFLCIDAYSQRAGNPVGLFVCHQNLTHPQLNQFWMLTHRREVRSLNEMHCLDVYEPQPNAIVWMLNCHGLGGNQFWWYDRRHQWLVHGRHGTRCMEAVVKGNASHVYVNICDTRNYRMRWTFGIINNKMLDKFFEGL